MLIGFALVHKLRCSLDLVCFTRQRICTGYGDSAVCFDIFKCVCKEYSAYRKFSIITYTLEADGNDIRLIAAGRYIPKIT